MGSQTNNLGTTAILIFIVVLILSGIFFIRDDISKNERLDIKSEQLLISLGADYENNYQGVNFLQTENNITDESTFEGVDAFARQYLEDKSEIQQKQSILETILNLPSLFLLIFGVQDSLILITFNTLIYGLISFLIGLQIFKAIRTGEVD